MSIAAVGKIDRPLELVLGTLWVSAIVIGYAYNRRCPSGFSKQRPSAQYEWQGGVNKPESHMCKKMGANDNLPLSEM